MRDRIVIGAACLMTIGCAASQTHTAASAVAQVATGQSCGADRVGEQDKSWREVKGHGFTFCVPEHWEPVGERGQLWRSSTVDFSWVAEASPFSRSQPVVNTARGQSSVPYGTIVATETVDGRTVRLELRDAGQDGTLLSSSQSLEPALRLYGIARDAVASREIVAAFRSVRFNKPQP